MYIRKDLLNKIKEVFDIKEFTYIGNGKYCYNNNDLFIFDCDDETIAIEVGTANFFSIYKAKENSDHPGYFYAVTQSNFLLFKDNKTHLKIDKKITTFPGKAFDFEKEFVIAALENN
ncbi:MAG: hypothetical protein MSA56_04625 [Clostridium sp.]|nr:hypothetical protein [Clostridium sp.]